MFLTMHNLQNRYSLVKLRFPILTTCVFLDLRCYLRYHISHTFRVVINWILPIVTTLYSCRRVTLSFTSQWTTVRVDWTWLQTLARSLSSTAILSLVECHATCTRSCPTWCHQTRDSQVLKEMSFYFCLPSNDSWIDMYVELPSLFQQTSLKGGCVRFCFS